MTNFLHTLSQDQPESRLQRALCACMVAIMISVLMIGSIAFVHHAWHMMFSPFLLKIVGYACFGILVVGVFGCVALMNIDIRIQGLRDKDRHIPF